MHSNNLTFIRPDNLNNDVVSSWFSLKNMDYQSGKILGFNLGTNTNDDPNVIEKNIELIQEITSTEPGFIALTKQVHSNKVNYVQSGGLNEGYDALVTDKPGVLLSIQVADCAAVLLADDQHKVIGAAHAGWRGAVSNVVTETINSMIELGAKTESIRVYISACISLERFEVGDEVADQFPASLVDYENYNKAHVDLKGLLKTQLIQEGIREESILSEDGCTMLENHKYYSYRKEGKSSGRMMALIKLKNNL